MPGRPERVPRRIRRSASQAARRHPAWPITPAGNRTALHSHVRNRSQLRLPQRRDVPGPVPPRTVAGLAELCRRTRRRAPEGARPTIPLSRPGLRLRAFDGDQRGRLPARRISRLRFQPGPYRGGFATRGPAPRKQHGVPSDQLRGPARGGAAVFRLHRDARHLQLGRRRRAARGAAAARSPPRRRRTRLSQLQLRAGLVGRGTAAQADARARPGRRRRHRDSHRQRAGGHAAARHPEPALLSRQSGRHRGTRGTRRRSTRLSRA